MKKIALVLALTLAASTAMAETVCGERDKFIDHLSDNFQEAPAAIGLASNGSVLEVLTSDESGTWTIIVTKPNGHACVVASGEAWQTVTPAEREKLALQSLPQY